VSDRISCGYIKITNNENGVGVSKGKKQKNPTALSLLLFLTQL
jgi:hypothetical protein